MTDNDHMDSPPADVLSRTQTSNLRGIGTVTSLAMAGFAVVAIVKGIALGIWQDFAIATLAITYAVSGWIALRLVRREKKAQAVALLLGSAVLTFTVSSLIVNDRNLLFSGKVVVLLCVLGVIMTTPPKWLGLGCLISLLGGLALVVLDLLRPSTGQFNDGQLLGVFFATLLAIAAYMLLTIALQFRTYPLATKFVALFLGIALLPTVTLGYVNSQWLRRELESDAAERMEAAARECASRVDTFLRERAIFAQIAAGFPAFLEAVYPEAFPEDERQGLDHINVILGIVSGGNEMDATHAYSLVDTQGRRIASTRPSLVGTTLANSASTHPPGLDQQAFSALYFDDLGPNSGLIDIHSPITDPSGQYRGCLVVSIDGDAVQDIASSMSGLAGTDSYAILVDEYGMRMADGGASGRRWTQTLPLSQNDQSELQAANRLPRGWASDEVLAPPGLESILRETPLDSAFKGTPEDADPNAIAGAMAPLASLPWHAVFVQSRTALYAPLRRDALFQFLSTVVVGLIALALGVACAQALSRPFERLVLAAERMRAGDYDVDIAPGGDIETGQLAGAFATMAARVSETMAGMEARIEELHASNAARESSEDALRMLFTNAPIGMVVADMQSHILQANRAACELFGREENELLGQDSRAFAHPDDREVAIHAGGTLMRGPDETVYFEKRYLRKNGEVFHAWVALTLLFDAERRPERFVAQMIDLTERTRAEKRLAESEARYRLISANSSDIITLQDPQGIVRYVSPAVERLLGWTPEEIVGQPFFDFVETERPGVLPDHVLQQFSLDASQPMLYKVRHRDGTHRWMETKGRAVADESTGITREIVSVTRDVTDRITAERERRELEAQIQHTQKLESLGVLAGGIAHDFNNLLVGILGHAGLALMDAREGTLLHEYVQSIETAALRASDLTKQLLAYSGKGQIVFESVDIGAIIAEMPQLLAVSTSKYAQIHTQLDDELPAIDGDATQVRQVVMNLITNASDAIGERPGVITIQTGTRTLAPDDLMAMHFSNATGPGLFVWLEVTDDGHGMAPEDITRIFEPFYTTKFTGRGLGLAAVLGIMQAHHGAIELDSTPEKGTRFRIYFPASPSTSPRNTQAPPLPAPTAPHRRYTVLVVDDEEVVRRTAQAALRRFGYDVLTAVDGIEGVEMYQQHRTEIDAVLLDLTMPRMDGEQCFYRLADLNPDICVIISSGYDEQDAIPRFRDRKPAAYIQKPYRPSELDAVLRRHLPPDDGPGQNLA